jgi:hypothetical protein
MNELERHLDKTLFFAANAHGFAAELLSISTHPAQTVSMSITSSTASEVESSSASAVAAHPNRITANRIGVAVRPTLLFMTAFALNASPHEGTHAVTAYMLGFSSTLYQMWVNPDAAEAAPRQLITIAVAGPIFSLIVGLISFVLYRWRYNRRPSGLLFLMLAIIAFYIPLGGSIFGDINLALGFGGASKLLMIAISIVAALMLSTMMYFMGKELCSWAPPWFSRSQAVLCTTVGPWLIGHVLITLVYLPLPKFLIAPNLVGSIFWVFAVIGAIRSDRTMPAVRPICSLTRADLIVTAGAFLMVRFLVHGVRLAP